MTDALFSKPILNSPYERPGRHWELDESGQPTHQIIEDRRPARFITPIPKPKKHKVAKEQQELVFNEGEGLSSQQQQYDPTSIINEVRQHVAAWRALPQGSWQVYPETARLLEYWRHHAFSGVRPLKSEINQEAWESLHSDTPRPFERPKSGRIAVEGDQSPWG